jgi:hypothetical protein
MSELKVNKVTPRSGTTVTLGDSGDTITIPSGATIDLSSATQTGVGGTNTPAFAAFSTAYQSVTEDTFVKLTFATEIFDTDSDYDNVTNHRFTPQVAGKYFVYARGQADSGAFANIRNSKLRFYKNGVAVSQSLSDIFTGANLSADGASAQHHHITNIIDMNGTTDYIEVFGLVDTWNDSNSTFGEKEFGAFKIIE